MRLASQPTAKRGSEVGNEDKDPAERDPQEEDAEAIEDLEVGDEAENVTGGTRNPDLGGRLA